MVGDVVGEIVGDVVGEIVGDGVGAIVDAPTVNEITIVAGPLVFAENGVTAPPMPDKMKDEPPPPLPIISDKAAPPPPPPK